MKNFLSAIIIWCTCLALANAEELVKDVTPVDVATVEVGKYVATNMDAI